MSNETYLIVSYFAVGVLCCGLGLAACWWLWRPFLGIVGALPHKNWRTILRKTFPPSMVLFVVSACLSVNYYGCSLKKYEQIVDDRSYIVAKNSEQISEALQAVIWSVGVWSTILVFALLTRRWDATGSQDHEAGEGSK